jgi:glucose-6-phosphate 1-dehydrogenase
MPDTASIRVPSASHRVAAPPRRGLKPADPCTLVIFGAGGDLTKRLVVPALYNLARTGILPEDFVLIGVDHGESDTDKWRTDLHDTLQSFVGNAESEFHIDRIDADAWRRLAGTMTYIRGDFTEHGLYERIGGTLEEARKSRRTLGNAIFYLAVPDRFFGAIIDHIGKAGLAGEASGWRRVVIEKPFGHSLDSARELDAEILHTLREEQIFRIDHFLGKDTVQSIMALRFANGLFEPIWNRDRIDHVQITVAETVGVEGRGKFYEATGALRDMVPNHVFSLLAMVAMEPPTGFHADAVRSRKAEVFAAIQTIKPAKAVRGQYDSGTVQGRDVAAYRSEPNVASDSGVETYVALQLEIDNWRWAGVPFFIRTGKHLAERLTEIAIRFKQAPYAAFENTPVDALRPNWLVLRIAPEEGISLQFEVKRRGPAVDLAAVKMDFRYDDWFPKEPNVGYETLLYDVMVGDPTLFMRADMVELTWRIVQPVLDHWAATQREFPNYKSGSAGPRAADELIEATGGRQWRPVALPDRSGGQEA